MQEESCPVPAWGRALRERGRMCSTRSHTDGLSLDYTPSLKLIPVSRRRIIKGPANHEAYAFSADLTAKEDIERLAKNAVEKLGGVDILAYNTGPPRPGTFSDLNEADWDYGVKLLLTSAVGLAKQVVPGMERKKWGRL